LLNHLVETGVEWLVDAHECDPDALRSKAALSAVFERIVADVGLHLLGEPVWHVFPGEAGITGLQLLSESHLACHTFPERGFASFNLYCCRPRAEWPWAERLREILGAKRVTTRAIPRGTE
jgi:S-adenosylmethionine decarboxylase